MKSRTSSFKTILRKDILRFAPLWAIYLIGGILVMLSVTDSVRAADGARNLANTIGPFSVINLIYAALAAQLLFGDLFQSRLCNALHAMPMRRETWFAGHVLSGLCYSVVPHIIGVLVLMTRLGGYWYVALIWLLGMTLEYLFFFGLAVFSVFCTGNRFAMAAVYAILNFLSLIVWWFVATVYEPALYGVAIPPAPFIHLCPVVSLFSQDLVLFERVTEIGTDGYRWECLGFGEGWDYLAVIAVIGIALLGISLLMYRRRALERAGDFIAVKPLAPVFSVVYTLCVGAVFALFGDLISDGYLLFLIIGIAVGYFTGQMLLQRTIRVFKPMAFVKLALLAAVLLGSVFAVKADPFGVTRWVPEKEQITMVEVSNSSGFYPYSDTLTLKKADDIEKIIQVHKSILDNRDRKDGDTVFTVAIRYHLKNGTQPQRVYDACLTDDAYRLLLSLYNKPEHILGYGVWTNYLNQVDTVILDGSAVTDKEACRELLEAVKADCEAGNMVQYWAFRNEAKADYCLGINIQVRTGIDTVKQTWIDVYTDAENTLKWLKEHQNLWNSDNHYSFD